MPLICLLAMLACKSRAALFRCIFLLTQGLLLAASTAIASPADKASIADIQALIAQQNYTQALEQLLSQLESIPDSDPRHPQLVQLQAISLAGQGRYRIATRLFTQLIDQGKANPATWLNLARLQLEQNRLQACEETLRSGLQHYPAHLPLHQRLIQLLLLKTRIAMDQARSRLPNDHELTRQRNIVSGLLLPRSVISDATRGPARHAARRCYRMGPWQDPQQAREAMEKLRQQHPSAKTRWSGVPRSGLQQLLATGFANHNHALQTLQQLQQAGIRDIALTRRNQQSVISLGVFRQPESLLRRKARLAAWPLQLETLNLGNKHAGRSIELWLNPDERAPQNARPVKCPSA